MMGSPHLGSGLQQQQQQQHYYPPPPVRQNSASSMPSFQHAQQPDASPQAQHVQQASDGRGERARAYKSRNKRPCDFCRYKKAACHLESSPPCELCIRYNKECTFVESPAKRRRPNDPSADGLRSVDRVLKHSSNGSLGGTSTFSNNGMGSMDMQHDMLPWESEGIAHFQMPSMPMGGNGMTPEFAFDPALYSEPMTFDAFEPISASTTANNNSYDHKFSSTHTRQSSSMETTSPASQHAALPLNLHLPLESTSGEPSLDRQESTNAQIVGISGESDPFLLSKYRFDAYREATFQSVRVRKMSSSQDGNIPTFFLLQHNALASKAQPQDRSETNDKWRRELEDMVSNDIGQRLIRLFYKYVQPYFPILSREGGAKDGDGSRELHQMPPCVLAAIYGHALPFCAWDERLCVDVYTPPSADALFKLAWLSCQSLLHTPNISVMQTLLLLVQRRPTNKHVSDTPFKCVIMSAAVSIAQALGLNRDPTDWPIPSWEGKQRKRLAWAVYVQDKWLTLNFGCSSHIQPEDWDVPSLTEDDFPEADRSYDEGAGSFSGQHFIQLCQLTQIVNELLYDLFSIKATRQLHKSLEATLEVAKPLRIKLTEWFQALPTGLLPNPSHHGDSAMGSPNGNNSRRSQSLELDGNGSLQLAYITAKIELFRAMLRPHVTDANAAAVTALRTGALAVAKEISEFLEGLNARELEAFWASCKSTTPMLLGRTIC